MAIRQIGGGNQGVTLKTVCTVKSTLQTTGPVVNDTVILSTSGNWVVDEHGTDETIDVCGIIRDLSDDKKIAVVEWYCWNKVFEADYSGTATRGQGVLTAASQTESVQTSANATAVRYFAIVAATDLPATGKLEFLAR